MAWQILAEPHGANPGSEEGRNEGGLVIYLVASNGGSRQEVTRVAWMRENSAHPDVPFQDQLDIEIEKAKKAVATMEELVAGAGTLQ